MFTKLREPFGKAGLTVAILALVMAMVGGAFAANHAATASKAKAGPRGKTGKSGPAGPAGPAGTAGAVGPKGAPGEPGAQGEPGVEGKEGSPWTAGGTLPSGATETGVFSARFDPTEAQAVDSASPISFTVPLAAPLDSSAVHYVTIAEQQGTPPAACQGRVQEPTAASGNLCLYQGKTVVGSEEVEGVPAEGKMTFSRIATPAGGLPVLGAETTGAIALVIYFPERTVAPAYLLGSWAVTG